MKISKRINDIIEELKDQYLEEDRCNRPWIIGFSGLRTRQFYSR